MPASLKAVANEDSRSPKLKDEAYVVLERLIVTGSLAPGLWVSETELMKVSGFSRASVRSAVQRLEDQDLVAVVPRRGAQICPIDYTVQFRALELRRVVERLIARSAAERADALQRQRFTELASGFHHAAQGLDQESMTELDSRTFTLMLEAANNRFAARAMTSVKGLSRRFWVLHREKYGDLPAMARAHADVASAIAAGSAIAAEQAVDHVVDYVEQFTLAVVGYHPAVSARVPHS